ncbi:MAG: peptidylprolyl isomerase [Phycisphaerales bacterium]
MNHRAPLAASIGLALGACLLALGCRTAPTPGDDEPVYVRMDTTLGPIVVELDPAHAPISVANFLAYVDAQEYDNTIFHRVVANFVIQGGGYSPDRTELPDRGTIRNEWLSGLQNERGTIAMAREAEPHTATRQWYINLVDNPKLDTARPQTGNAGYAVFGRVVSGLDVVDAIGRLPTRARGAGFENLPVDVPVVLTIRRIDDPDAPAPTPEPAPTETQPDEPESAQPAGDVDPEPTGGDSPTQADEPGGGQPDQPGEPAAPRTGR